MTTLSSFLTRLLVQGDLRCSAPAVGPRTGSCSVLASASGAARDRLVIWRAGSRSYHPLSGTTRVPRDCREGVVHNSRRKALERRNWQCSANVEESEAEATQTVESSSPSSPSNCCTDATERGDSASTTDIKEKAVIGGDVVQEFEAEGPGKRGNQLFALASVTIAVGLFLSGRFGGDSPGLPQLAATAVSYEEALSNGRPTVVEFYADWCEVCKETAHDVYEIEQEYKGQINFVMLNVDNSKWEEELDEFGVEGIPHFAFLDKQGNEEGNIVGRLPGTILKENLAALARGDATIPHSRVRGQFSSADSRQAPPVVDPRSHGQIS